MEEIEKLQFALGPRDEEGAGVCNEESLMANDSGSASTDNHLVLIWTTLAGLILTDLAGISGGVAIIMGKKQKPLWICCFVLFICGVALQVVAFMRFFND